MEGGDAALMEAVAAKNGVKSSPVSRHFGCCYGTQKSSCKERESFDLEIAK